MAKRHAPRSLLPRSGTATLTNRGMREMRGIRKLQNSSRAKRAATANSTHHLFAEWG
ncbi:hypothetical protein [Nostoc sp. MS1]|uniref:hypothetical protein n=1 Tax=Nostoc sp. MS1 TaxID=2764711 RepID=UPI001CC4A855|nr:hypothetical protein [Nostoc sp. MS1]